MASTSDGGPVVLPSMPDFSAPSSSLAGDMKYHLQALLDSKEKQLQQAGTLGQRVLAQQMELEERIRQLQEMDGEELDGEARERYKELAETIRTWDEENEKLSSAFTDKQRLVNGSPPSPSVTLSDYSREEPERSKTSAVGTSTAQSRRAKNAAHRADDVEFAFEIGSGLLTEVRRLQSLLAERDKAIQDSKEEKDDLEKSVESLRTALRSQEQSADKYKEENWNLEVSLQELRTQLSDSQDSTKRLESEHKRLTKLLAASRDSSDQQKTESERLKTSLDELKAKHDTDIAQARKHAAGLQRDKSDLQSAVEKLKVDVAKAGRRLPGRFGSPLTPNGPGAVDYLTPAGDHEDDVFGGTGAPSTRGRKIDAGLFPADFDPDSSPEPSPSKPFVGTNQPASEIEALHQRLAHANRQINTLKGTLRREKELRMDYRRKLEGSPGGLQGLVEDELEEKDEDFEDEDIEEKKKKVTPFRSGGARRGRGRGRGGLTLQERLGMAANSPSSEYGGESRDPESPPPPVPPIRFQEALGEEEEDDYTIQGQEQAGNRTSVVSVEGMDPAFANVLRKSSLTAVPSTGSPLRQSVIARTAGRRARGGAAYQDGRPSSLVGQPEALAAELGLGADSEPSHLEEFIAEEVTKETVDFGCQTDFEESPAVSSIVATSEIAIQVDLEPVLKSETSSQTVGEPTVPRKEMAVQYDPAESARLFVPTGRNSVLSPTTDQFDVQTPHVGKVPLRLSAIPGDEYERDRRTTLVPGDITRASVASAFSGDTTITRSPGRAFLAPRVESEDDESERESGAETDLEKYHDARQSIVLQSASQSTDDFHSVMTMTDNDFSGTDDDGESIKASRISHRGTSVAGTSVGGRSSFYARIPRESKGSLMDTVETPKTKVEVKEVSVQTDDWTPPVVVTPTPVPTTSPTSSGFGLYRVGSTGQQFTFVAPPPPSAPSAPATPAATPAAAVVIPALTGAVRDSSGTFGRSPRTSHADRRQSLESAVSSIYDDAPTRPRVPSAPSGGLQTVDKSKPPMMVLPPPPRLPPPPNSMLPPAFIPERRHNELPPPRPSSSPPPELIQRATTPTFGSKLSLGGKGSLRQPGSSMPPPQNLRQPISTSSFRSAANAAAAYSQQGQGALSSFSGREILRQQMSTTSLTSDRSPRSSMSSADQHLMSKNLPSAPVTPRKQGPVVGGSTDPSIIHAITQTMIGEFLYKYTRRTIGKGHGQGRHRRFFWVHPYTKTLYWSSADPGSSNVSESSAKSAYIEGVRSVLDPNPMPPGLHQYSVIVSTPQREMKFTAPTKERHDIWLNALKYLLARPNSTVTSPANATLVPSSPVSLRHFTDEENRPPLGTPQSLRDARSPRRADTWNITPRGQRSRSQLSVGGSIGKRSGTPAHEYLRWTGPDSPYSPTKSFEHIPSNNDHDDLDFELHGDERSDDGFEGLENVRACCDGRHTVGHSGKDHHHHHPQHDLVHNGDRHLDVQPTLPERPVSPSWSFRSRTASANSHEGGAGFLSWGRGDDGKLRFGSRRSTKTAPAQDQ